MLRETPEARAFRVTNQASGFAYFLLVHRGGISCDCAGCEWQTSAKANAREYCVGGEMYDTRGCVHADAVAQMMADNLNPDPGNRAAFSSHVRPLPLWLRFDRNETISIFITPKGLFPFPKTPADSFCGNICVLLHGWIASLIDNRDGAMRPIDVGRMREGSGDELASAVSADDMTLLVQWLTDVGATQGA